mgnify:CR=1 FL=1
MKQDSPKFIGTIQQRYRPRNGSPVKAFHIQKNQCDRVVVKDFRYHQIYSKQTVLMVLAYYQRLVTGLLF